MEAIVFKETKWDEIEGHWQKIVREEFHIDYLGIGEAYCGIDDVDSKLESMSDYSDETRVWGAWSGDDMIGLIVALVDEERLLLYDLLVSKAFRRQRIAQKLIELAIKDSQVSVVAAEINAKNIASQGLAKMFDCQPAFTSHWFEVPVPEEEPPQSH